MRKVLTALDLDVLNIILARDPALAEHVIGKVESVTAALGPLANALVRDQPSPEAPEGAALVLSKAREWGTETFHTVAQFAGLTELTPAVTGKAIAWLVSQGKLRDNGKATRGRAYALSKV